MGPIDIPLATKCLEAARVPYVFLISGADPYTSFFSDMSDALLASIYLQSAKELYNGSLPDSIEINWGVPANIEKASEILKERRGTSTSNCDIACWDRLQAELDSRLAEIEKVKRDKEEAKRLELVADEQETLALAGLCEGYISLKKVCWAHSLLDMSKVLSTEGYYCEVTKWDGLEEGLDCKDESKQVFVRSDVILFNCDAFNVCSYKYDEIAKMLVDQGFVDELQLNVREVVNLDGVRQLISEYCGRGNRGDELCVVNDINILGMPTINIKLKRGSASGDAPSFD
jgi:hypothetical protein